MKPLPINYLIVSIKDKAIYSYYNYEMFDRGLESFGSQADSNYFHVGGLNLDKSEMLVDSMLAGAFAGYEFIQS